MCPHLMHTMFYPGRPGVNCYPSCCSGHLPHTHNGKTFMSQLVNVIRCEGFNVSSINVQNLSCCKVISKIFHPSKRRVVVRELVVRITHCRHCRILKHSCMNSYHHFGGATCTERLMYVGYPYKMLYSSFMKI